MRDLEEIYTLIMEIGKLRLVFRQTRVLPDRQESSAEHSWSVAMIAMMLMDDLRREFGLIDELKTIQLGLIHDVVEIYAGDAFAFDAEARQEKAILEKEAMAKIVAIYPPFGRKLDELWSEFEARETLEAKIAKGCDVMCAVFQRIRSRASYASRGVDRQRLDALMLPALSFSQTFLHMYARLKEDLVSFSLI
ncbi:MAG: HD domain-containing protein [Gammaproteobacteria bacterium]|nr:HD domain-containing protein [Gammaproteobacteria bacterium]MCD8525185.1 HD domain-containing protein [Gammaproteobacteria bacterium]MCD8543078.1 HD domain-containing protein [Gammaproteobacteria bacterium]MCD8573794.1 HD domain-containing protein [Gammaproteobacteria bacterium]